MDKQKQAEEYYNTALELIEKENYYDAINEISKAIAFNPEDINYYIERAYLYFETGYLTKSIIDCNYCLRNNPSLDDIFCLRGNSRLELCNYKSAEKDFLKAMILKPNEFGYLYNYGLVNFKLGKYKIAIKYLTESKIINPNYSSTYYYLGLCKIETNEFKPAIKNFNKSLAIDSDFIEVYYDRGISYFQNEEYEKAKSDFNKTIKLQPKNTDALFYRAGCNFYLEEYEKAIDDLDIFIDVYPESIEALNKRALCNLKKKNYQAAQLDFQTALDLNSDSIEAHNGMLQAYFEMQVYQNALFHINKLIKLVSNDYILYFNKAKIYENLNDIDSALENYDKTIELVPNSAELLYQRGILEFQQNNIKNAMNDFDDAVTIDNSFYHAYYMRSILHLRNYNTGEALSNIEKAINLAPKIHYFYYTRALIQLSQNNLHEALNSINQSIKFNVDELFLHKIRALIYYLLEDLTSAKSDYEFILNKTPFDCHILYNNALINLSLKNIQDAIIDFNKVITHSSDEFIVNEAINHLKMIDENKSLNSIDRKKYNERVKKEFETIIKEILSEVGKDFPDVFELNNYLDFYKSENNKIKNDGNLETDLTKSAYNRVIDWLGNNIEAHINDSKNIMKKNSITSSQELQSLIHKIKDDTNPKTERNEVIQDRQFNYGEFKDGKLHIYSLMDFVRILITCFNLPDSELREKIQEYHQFIIFNNKPVKINSFNQTINKYNGKNYDNKKIISPEKEFIEMLQSLININ